MESNFGIAESNIKVKYQNITCVYNFEYCVCGIS